MINLSYDGPFLEIWVSERMGTFFGRASGPGGIRRIAGAPFYKVTPTKICIGIPVTNFRVNKK